MMGGARAPAIKELEEAKKNAIKKAKMSKSKKPNSKKWEQESSDDDIIEILVSCAVALS